MSTVMSIDNPPCLQNEVEITITSRKHFYARPHQCHPNTLRNDTCTYVVLCSCESGWSGELCDECIPLAGCGECLQHYYKCYHKTLKSYKTGTYAYMYVVKIHHVLMYNRLPSNCMLVCKQLHVCCN